MEQKNENEIKALGLLLEECEDELRDQVLMKLGSLVASFGMDEDEKLDYLSSLITDFICRDTKYLSVAYLRIDFIERWLQQELDRKAFWGIKHRITPALEELKPLLETSDIVQQEEAKLIEEEQVLLEAQGGQASRVQHFKDDAYDTLLSQLAFESKFNREGVCSAEYRTLISIAKWMVKEEYWENFKEDLKNLFLTY